MFVDPVCSDPDVQFDEQENIGTLAHRSVKFLDDSQNLFYISRHEPLLKATLSHRDIKPMMSSCSVKYKQNADGSYEIMGEVYFRTNNEKEKETENKDAEKEPPSVEYDPPHDRDK